MAFGAGSYPEPQEKKYTCENCSGEFHYEDLIDVLGHELCEDCALDLIQDNSELIINLFK